MKRLLIVLIAAVIAVGLNAVWLIDENFESGVMPTGWTVYDQDNDGRAWHILNYPTQAHSGSKIVMCEDFLPHVNNDWLVTQPLVISVGDSLHFWARSWFSTENFKVKLSTTGNAISNFTTTLLNVEGIGTTYQNYHIDLSAYAGEIIYLAFYWQCDNYGMVLDDIKVGQAAGVLPVLNLPETFTFEEDQSLSVDFTPYITAGNINIASLSVSGNTHVNVVINNRNVTLTSPGWSGSELLTFTLNDGMGNPSVTDNVSVIVTPRPAADLGILSISCPVNYVYLNRQIYPEMKIKNYSASTFNGSVDLLCNIFDAADNVVYSQPYAYSGVINADSVASIVFPVAWNTQTTGNFRADFIITTTDDNQANNELSSSFAVYDHHGTSQPDAFGYQWIDSEEAGGPAFNWIDISSTGTSSIMYGVNAFHGDDNFSEPIPFGFNFPYYGLQYSQAYVDINGEMLLCPNAFYDEYPSSGWGSDGFMFNYTYPVPGFTQMPGLISVFWDDLLAVEGTGDVFFQTFGEIPNRYFIVQWNNLRYVGGTGGTPTLKFEAILYENGDIVYQYLNVINGQTGSVAVHDSGRSTTVGIQNQDAQIGLCYLREIVQGTSYIGIEPEGNLLHNNLAIKFYCGVDMQPPFISYNQQGNTFDSTPSIVANITDMSALPSVLLHYNIGNEWQTITYTEVIDQINYSFTLPELPLGSVLNYYFEATDAFDHTSRLPANSPVEYYSFKILPGTGVNTLILYSGNQDYQNEELPVYISSLDAMDVVYDVYDWEEYRDYTIPAQYTTLYSYSNSSSHTDKMLYYAQEIMRFLDTGTVSNPKNIFFASDGMAFNQGGSPNSDPIKKLFEAYFRAAYIGTGVGGGTNGLAGPDAMGYSNGTIKSYEGSPIGETNIEIPVYANSPDCIFNNDECPSWYADEVQNPEIGSHYAYYFEDGPVNGQAYLYHGVCGTWIDNLIYKAFYFSFDFSQVTSQINRDSMIADAVVWFGTPTGIDQDVISPQFTLRQNYPNPFNPNTTIEFATSMKNAETNITIYNSKGEKVRTLINQTLPKGSHKVVWDGKDDNQNSVSSGIYIYKFRNGNIAKTKKMILTK